MLPLLLLWASSALPSTTHAVAAKDGVDVLRACPKLLANTLQRHNAIRIISKDFRNHLRLTELLEIDALVSLLERVINLPLG